VERRVGILAFALAVAFIPGALRADTVGRYALLAVVVPFLVGFPPRLTAGHLFGGLFLAWGAASLTWTSSIYDGLDELVTFLIMAGLFCIGSELRSMRPVYIGLGASIAINSAIAAVQWYGGETPTGLFLIKNYLAEPAALVLIGLIGNRLWLFAALALPAVLLPHARGALVALAAAGAAWCWTRSRRLTGVVLAVMAAACIGWLWLEPSGGDIAQRFAIWRDTIDCLTPLGHGLGAFFTDYVGHASRYNIMAARPAHAHNDFLEIVYELGPGILPFMALLAYSLAGRRRTESLVLIAFCVEACFAFPLHFPVPSFLAALAAGHLCRDGNSLRGNLALCASRIRSWARAAWPGGRRAS
jgi:hypothetical protein